MVLAPDVLAVFLKYRQRFFWQPESGGILLGRRRGKHLEVLLATEPTLDDKRSTYSFQRGAAGHAEVAQQAWLKGNRQIDYLGEWHTHPQEIPIPSGIDRAEWCKLIPVSYTHLDVYKRQAWFWTSSTSRDKRSPASTGPRRS